MTPRYRAEANARGRSPMPDQFSKLGGYTLKYPYLVGISTESGGVATGILISARFVLTCGHVLRDSASAEVISQQGCTSARIQKVDDSLDLALLELAQSISAPKATFTDFPLQPGAVLWAVGIQETPGQPDELSVAQVELKYRNKNDADGKTLDFQVEGGARPGYSGGPVIAEEGGVLRCVGVIRLGGFGASSSNAVGLASIEAFLKDYLLDMPKPRVGTNADGIRRFLILSATLFAVFGVSAIAKWLYVASHNSRVTSGTVMVGKPEAAKTEGGQSVPGKNTSTEPSNASPGQTPAESTGTAYIVPPQSPAEANRVGQGTPDVRVWVNTGSNVYRCPGGRKYGNTAHGKYMTQVEAQKQGNRPAYGKVCI